MKEGDSFGHLRTDTTQCPTGCGAEIGPVEQGSTTIGETDQSLRLVACFTTCRCLEGHDNRLIVGIHRDADLKEIGQRQTGEGHSEIVCSFSTTAVEVGDLLFADEETGPIAAVAVFEDDLRLALQRTSAHPCFISGGSPREGIAISPGIATELIQAVGSGEACAEGFQLCVYLGCLQIKTGSGENVKQGSIDLVGSCGIKAELQGSGNGIDGEIHFGGAASIGVGGRQPIARGLCRRDGLAA